MGKTLSMSFDTINPLPDADQSIIMNTDKLISQERHHINVFLTALILASVSGFISYLIPGNTVWLQWTYLLHVFTGILMSIPLLRYTARHFKRTQGLKRPLMTISGILSVVIIIYVSVSGFHITLFGQSESGRWIYNTHVLAATTGLIIIILHIISHKLSLSTKRKKQAKKLNSLFNK